MDPSTRSYFYELGKAHADVDPVRDAEITKIVRQALKKLAAEPGSINDDTRPENGCA